MTDRIVDKEKKKYDYLHKLSGFDQNQNGYCRQLQLLLASNMVFFDMLRNDLKKDHALEIGCGSGEMTAWLCKNYNNSMSIDISGYAVDSLRALLKVDHKKIVECSASSLSFNDISFDSVVHLDGMEHIPEEIEHDCLSEAVRVCKRGGRIYYANACSDAWWDHKLVQAGYDLAHINIKTFDKWKEFYRAGEHVLGYKIIHHETAQETFYIVLEKN